MQPGERQGGLHGGTSAHPDASGPHASPHEASPPGASGPTADLASGASGATEAAADIPGIPEAVRAAARRAPGYWIGVVDPEWTQERTPPEWAVLGEWQSDESGSVGEYRANPAYRPSARVLGWPDPTDPVDAAAQRAATGYGSVEAALTALAQADVTVVRGPDGGPLTAPGRDGAPVVLLFTSPAHEFMSVALHHDTLPARELALSSSGAGTLLLVNAGAAAPLLVPADSLLGPVDGAGDEAAYHRAPAADDAEGQGLGPPFDTAVYRTGAPAEIPSGGRTDHSSRT